MSRLDGLTDILEQAKDLDPEVVVNDWGVLRRVRSRRQGPRPVLGRGLNRMMRDPRLPDVGPEHLGGDPTPDSWKKASHDSGPFRRLMASLGIERAETDAPLQGLDAVTAGGPSLTLHMPYGMVASGRICMVSGWGKPASVRFVPPRRCDAPCRRFTIELRAPWSRRQQGATELPLVREGEILPLNRLLNRRRNSFPEPALDPAPRFLQKGNTHFYRLDEAGIRAALQWIASNDSVDRLVVEPDLPM